MKYVYLFLFAVITFALQIFFLDRMWYGLFISLYISVLLIIDVKIPHWILLLLGFSLGALIDVLTAGAGLNCAVTGFLALCRPFLVRFTLPSGIIESGGVISVSVVPLKKYFTYLFCAFALWSVPFFFLEAGFISPLQIVLRILLNSVVGPLLLILIQLPFEH